jgi:predicted regulator of Ras-like GTPase activity (Roadblock/LC7/MglB family)
MSKKEPSQTPEVSNPKYLQGQLESILYRINQEGEFKASIISTLDGFSIASASSQFDDVLISALSSIVQETSNRAEKYMGFKRMDEVSLVDDDKFRLVCRGFNVEDSQFILTVIVPPNKTYRRLTNEAIKEIEKIIQEKRKKIGD